MRIFRGIVIGAPISLALWGLMIWSAAHFLRWGGLSVVAFYSFASFYVDEMDAIAGKTRHRFIIMIGCVFKPMLYVLVGHRTGENQVFCHRQPVSMVA